MTLLRSIAYRLHVNRLKQVSRADLEQFWIPQIIEESVDLPHSLDSVVVLSNIERRSQILVENGFAETGLPLLSFSHLTFQEYLTSLEYLDLARRKSAAEVRRDLLKQYEVDREWWEEVVLLYAAQLGRFERESFLQDISPEAPGI